MAEKRTGQPGGLGLDQAFVVIDGPIGVGKSSLTRRLADRLGAGALLEAPEENPFLDRFYENRRRFALPAQLFFLFQRHQLLEGLKQGDLFHAGVIADFLWAKDRVFARLNLDDDEWRLYEQVAHTVVPTVRSPDLVVFLQAPVDVLMERIRRRGRYYERIDREYLAAVSEAYTSFFHTYQEAPLLMVNAAEANFVESDEDLASLVDYVQTVRSGRHFFNPLASGLRA